MAESPVSDQEAMPQSLRGPVVLVEERMGVSERGVHEVLESACRKLVGAAASHWVQTGNARVMAPIPDWL